MLCKRILSRPSNNACRDAEAMLPPPRQTIPKGAQDLTQPPTAGEDPNKGYGSPEAAAAADRLLQLGVTVNPPGKSGAVDWGALAGSRPATCTLQHLANAMA